MTLLGVWQLMLTYVGQLWYLSRHRKGEASTPQNITAAKQNKLKISLPWLTEMLQNPDKDGHPCTGTPDHYVFYDKFHEANTKDPQEVLRRIILVPELQGSLNSQVAKQQLQKQLLPQ